MSKNLYMSINFTSVSFSYAKEYVRFKIFVSKDVKQVFNVLKKLCILKQVGG